MLFGSAPFISYAYGAYVSTGNATNITPMNATFNGVVNTGGLPGNAWFEYGTDVSFGNSTSLNALILDIVAITAPMFQDLYQTRFIIFAQLRRILMAEYMGMYLPLQLIFQLQDITIQCPRPLSLLPEQF